MMNSLSTYARRLTWGALPLLFIAFIFTGCDDGELLSPDPEAGDMFARYVAIGNSITAGFQSNGINANTQADSYANLMAQQMGTEFNLPSLTPPGCPPPLVQVFPEPEILGGENAPPCRFRTTPIPTVLNNVAVPGAEVVDVLSNTDAASNANSLTTFILGGRTQIEAAREVQPTFASVWIGNNDVLGAALAGNTDLITPMSDFQSRYTQMLDDLDAMEDLEGGVLIGVANVTSIPNLSPGAAYYQAEAQIQQALPTFNVADNCAPSESGARMLVPFQYAFRGLIGVASQGATVTLNCEDNRPLAQILGPGTVPASLAGVSIVTGQEIAELTSAVQNFNTLIAQQAESRGYAFWNPNDLFSQSEIQDQIPPFPQGFPLGNEPAFGPYFSLDGVHPSSAAHELVANEVIGAINSEYGTSIPTVPNAGQ